MHLLQTDTESAREMPVSYVDDLIRAMRVFVSHEGATRNLYCTYLSDISEEMKAQLLEFMSLNNLAQAIHSIHCKLGMLGHPDFQGCIISLNEDHSQFCSKLFETRLRNVSYSFVKT